MKQNLRQLEIQEQIRHLEEQQSREWEALQDEIKETFESIKPLNILKRNIVEFAESKDLKETVIANITGLATGFLSKAIVSGNSKNPIKNVAGSFIQLLVSNGIARNPELVMSVASKISSLLGKKETPEEDSPEAAE